MLIRFRSWWLVVLTAGLLTGCAGGLVPLFSGPTVLTGGPRPPILNPNLLGQPNRNIEFIDDLAGLQACLDAGASAFGATLQTTNVRSQPDVESCRIGKIERGALVEIVGYTVVTEDALASAQSPTLSAVLPTPTPAALTPQGPQIGYVEDIQPIFERSCTACHSAAARIMGLQTTTYRALMEGSDNGVVVIPGDPDNSKLWEMVSQGKMPATGPLPPDEQQIVYEWIVQGAAERRAAPPPAPTQPPVAQAGAQQPARTTVGTWLTVGPGTKLTDVPDACEPASDLGSLVSSDLILPISCGVIPNDADLARILSRVGLRPAVAAATSGGAAAPVRSTSTAQGASAAPATNENTANENATNENASQDAATTVAPAAAAPARPAAVGQAPIRAAALGLPAPSEDDPYLTPRGGFCIDRRLPDNTRGITAITFAPDGRMFLALDSNLARDVDPLILYDAYHPSRSVAIYDWVNNSSRYEEIFTESSRITGLDYSGGALYLSRAGEVGRIPDGGGYEKLADGFAVQSQLFHANNGIVISNGWVYISAGGVVDGYVEGPIVGIGEDGAQQIVSGGNPYAARIVRAPLSDLLAQRSITVFSTAARGVRNPYGITDDPAGRIWFTDNGATNVPDSISAGDEVNMLDPAAIGGGEGATPFYGFPLTLSGESPDWYVKPVVDLVNSAAPTGITWAYDTVYFGVYGRYPGLYRVGRTASGAAVAERILHGWPILAVATAPDGAIWIGMGAGGLYRITPGCAN
jgi:hypothetical protein